MELKQLAEQLRADGIAKGLCQAYRMKIRESNSIEGLVKLFIKGIDFCVINDYPTLDFMRDNFRGKSEPYGAHVDDEVDEANLPHCVLNGQCKAFLRYDGYSVSRVYARHDTQAAVNVADHAFVTVDAFDHSHLAIAVAGNDAKVLVNVYGDAQVECIGSGIQVKRINKKTY